MVSQDRNRFTLNCTRTAKDLLMEEGIDAQYGARHLKRPIEHHLVIPLSSLIASSQIQSGDDVVVDWPVRTEALSFSKALEPQAVAAAVA